MQRFRQLLRNVKYEAPVKVIILIADITAILRISSIIVLHCKLSVLPIRYFANIVTRALVLASPTTEVKSASK